LLLFPAKRGNGRTMKIELKYHTKLHMSRIICVVWELILISLAFTETLSRKGALKVHIM
jgi:hypothetical protein